MPRIYTLFNRSIWNILEKAVSLQRQEEDLGYPGRIPRGAAAKNQHCFGSKTSPPLLHFKNSRHAYHQNCWRVILNGIRGTSGFLHNSHFYSFSISSMERLVYFEINSAGMPSAFILRALSMLASAFPSALASAFAVLMALLISR